MENSTTTTTAWQTAQLLILREKTQSFKELELKTWSIDYVKRAIEMVPEKITLAQDLEEFKAKTEELILALPVQQENGKLKGDAYKKLITSYNTYIRTKYNMIAKGHYVAVWLPLGVALGIPFGLPFKNIALGIPIGLGIGGAISMILESKAAKENRVL